MSLIKQKKKIPSNSKVVSLYPRLESDSVWKAEFLPCDVRYPIILPRKNWVTKLIVKHYQSLSSLSTRFWIIAAREEIIKDV